MRKKASSDRSRKWALQEEIIAQLGVKTNHWSRGRNRKSWWIFLNAIWGSTLFWKAPGNLVVRTQLLAGRLAQLAVEEMRAEMIATAFVVVSAYGVQADEDDAQKALAFIQPGCQSDSQYQGISWCHDKGQRQRVPKSLILTRVIPRPAVKRIAQYALAGSYSGAGYWDRSRSRKCHGLFH